MIKQVWGPLSSGALVLKVPPLHQQHCCGLRAWKQNGSDVHFSKIPGDLYAPEVWEVLLRSLRGQREPGTEQGVRVWRAPSPEEAVLTGTFLWPPILQGLFFDDSYGFYPGQVLIGPAKIFSSVQWLSGVKPVLSTKSKFRVLVEEVGVGAGRGGGPGSPAPAAPPGVRLL